MYWRKMKALSKRKDRLKMEQEEKKNKNKSICGDLLLGKWALRTLRAFKLLTFSGSFCMVKVDYMSTVYKWK